MHFHGGAVEALHAFLAVIVLGFFWRWVAGYLATRDGVGGSFGKAMSAIY